MSSSNRPLLLLACNWKLYCIQHRQKQLRNAYCKITPNLLFEYQCTSGKYLSDCRIESNRKNRFGSENRFESNRNFFSPELECSTRKLIYCNVNIKILVCQIIGPWRAGQKSQNCIYAGKQHNCWLRKHDSHTPLCSWLSPWHWQALGRRQAFCRVVQTVYFIKRLNIDF